MISKSTLLPKGSVVLIGLILASVGNRELVRGRGIVIAQSCYNGNALKEVVQLTENTLGDVHYVSVIWGRRFLPVRRTVASPDDKVWFRLKLVHRLQGGEDKSLRGVAAVVTCRSYTRQGNHYG